MKKNVYRIGELKNMEIQDCAVEQMNRYNRHHIFVVTFDISVS